MMYLGTSIGGVKMAEIENRMHRVCFTGHRPEKLTRSENAIKKIWKSTSGKRWLMG